MAAITAAAMRNRVLNMVYSAQPAFRPYQTPLATASINASVQTIDVPTGTGGAWQVNDEGEFEDGERFLVTAVSTDALTVIRGHGGTTPASHVQDDIITQNPRFTVEQIDQVVDDAVVDLAPDIYELHTITDTYSSTTDWFPMDAAGDDRIFDVLSVYVKFSGEDHPTPVNAWRFVQGVDATGFTKTNGVYIPGAFNLNTGDSFYIATKKKYLTITDLDADSPAVRVVAHYAVYKLLGMAEVSRTQDPGRRTDRTVQPGTESRSSIWYLREAERLRAREAGRLDDAIAWLPRDRRAQRARRFRF